jgi:hypothetical protein
MKLKISNDGLYLTRNETAEETEKSIDVPRITKTENRKSTLTQKKVSGGLPGSYYLSKCSTSGVKVLRIHKNVSINRKKDKSLDKLIGELEHLLKEGISNNHKKFTLDSLLEYLEPMNITKGDISDIDVDQYFINNDLTVKNAYIRIKQSYQIMLQVQNQQIHTSLMMETNPALNKLYKN